MAEDKDKLNRTTMTTSRLMDFCSEKELTAQTGHSREDWPLVILKELMDNALDACEEADIAPEIDIVVSEDAILIRDNGPGLAPEIVEKILDFSVRVSSREAYIAPDRGAQGNALKTITMMPFVLDGNAGRIEITAKSVHHVIDVKVDSIRQEPVVGHNRSESSAFVKNGSEIRSLC